jgi:hypothetical protein
MPQLSRRKTKNKKAKMQTITTKYLGATNFKGSRIKATNSSLLAASVTIGYDWGLGLDGNHKKAAKKLKTKLNWHGKLYGGHTESGMVWVFVDREVTA